MAERILFFFSALGVFNALLLAFYLTFLKPNRHLPDYFIGMLLLCLVVRVGVSSFHFFGTIPEAAIKLGLIANLFLGPLTFFMMKALIEPEKNTVNQIVWHLSLLSIGFAIAWLLFDFATWDWKIRYVIHSVLTMYLLYAGFNWRSHLKTFLISKATAVNIRKALILYVSLVMICIGFAVSLFTSYILGPLTFSLIFYLVAWYFISNTHNERKPSSLKKIEEPEFMRLNQKLTNLMENEKLFRNPDLNLELLANRLSVNRHLLSQLLNDNLEKSFHHYVNDYRVQEACELLKENKHLSIEAIGYEAGFHSRSSFFSSFKKMTGVTPSKYREQD